MCQDLEAGTASPLRKARRKRGERETEPESRMRPGRDPGSERIGIEMASRAFKLGTIDPSPSAVDGIHALGGLSEAAPGRSFELDETLRGHEDSEHHGSAGLGILWALGLEVAGVVFGYGIWLLWRLW
jgi:hypothetical protein